MRRIPHYVRRNDKNETLHNCIFVDTETDEIKIEKGDTGYVLRFGWACFTRRQKDGVWSNPEWKRFTTVDDFWLWALPKATSGHKLWIWCHNASFDFPIVDAFVQIPKRGWELKVAIVDCPPFVVKYRKYKRTLMLADTLNIWRMSLAEMGKRCGLPKLEHDLKWGNQEQDDAYCRRDVEIIQKSVTEWADFLRHNDLGGFCPTVAAQAMRTFRHRYLEDRILIEDNHVALELARSCYHGGRVEAGFIGRLEQPVEYVDVNSMYPYVMSRCEMPLRLVGISTLVQPWQLKELLKDYCVCAHVRLDTPEPFAAILRDKKLIFPTGKFDAYLTSPELHYALSLDAIKEVHLTTCYEKGVPFKNFALNLYARKEACERAGNKLEASHFKKLLNSFYGKWGQNGRKWSQVGVCDPHLFDVRPEIDFQTKKQTLVRRFGGIVSVRAEDGESSESHPAIAAHICAHARMILYALIRQLAPEDYFYCDTDGLLVSRKGFEQLSDRIDNYQLGCLKHVQTFNDVTIYGCKDLILDGEEKTKGISKKAAKLDGCTYRQLKWHSIRGLLHTGRLDLPRTSVVTKTLRRTYTKGTVLPSGFVVPLHLEEWK